VSFGNSSTLMAGTRSGMATGYFAVGAAWQARSVECALSTIMRSSLRLS
jgi:hypothetical protein